MKKINTATLSWEPRTSPTGTFSRAGKHLSVALGHDRRMADANRRHPFDVEITTIPPGAAAFPYHSHSAQWEFYHVVSGTGSVRDEEGVTAIEAGDAFVFRPNEPHQIRNDGDGDLVYYVIADNPVGESCHYPDSRKWAVKGPEYRLIRSEPLDYYDGEE
jgi:uncharacterized cupin superfamily protein